MPTVKDKPPTAKAPGAPTQDRVVAPPRPVTTEPLRRPERYTRWIGWLLALTLAVVAASITTVVLMDDEPAANLGATLELRLAKDAIEGHQQEVISGDRAAPELDLGAVRMEQLLQKEAIASLNADRSFVYVAPEVAVVAVRLEQLLQKEAIDELNASRYETPMGSDLATALDMRLLKERIEEGR